VETTAAPATTPTVGPQVTPSGDDGVDGWIVILTVVVVLGTVVLIAWLLKPLVVRRLIGEAGAEQSEDTSEPQRAAWPDRQETTTSPLVVATRPELDEPFEEITPVDVSDEASEEAVEAEPTVVVTTTVEPPFVVSVPLAADETLSDEVDAAVNAEEIVGITLTVRELLEFANAGQLLRGFDLYSESYLQRFRAETGLTDEQFVEEYGSIPAPPPEARIELTAVTDIESLSDGRVSALISFGNGEQPPRPERFVFVRDAGRWLIDDITSAG
jgi:hypothetical protein